jgi:hypothetical protein
MVDPVSHGEVDFDHAFDFRFDHDFDFDIDFEQHFDFDRLLDFEGVSNVREEPPVHEPATIRR